MATVNSFQGVSNCYVFKSRLQEYAQKAGIPTPVYETMKEGPSHEPCFRSTVIVNNTRYDSLPGFFNRKAAEQSAAEVAIMELFKSGDMADCIPHPVHETGLCKNLLQEYAQKMNYAIPAYICDRPAQGNTPFSCTVEIGGIQYIGAAAKTKKEAEIKAARTALLAIQSNGGGSELNQNGGGGGSGFTVVPCKKKGRESETNNKTTDALKPKKSGFKKRWSKWKFSRNKGRFNKNEQGIDGAEDASGGGNIENSEMLDPSIGLLDGGQIQDSSVVVTDTSVVVTDTNNQNFQVVQPVESNRNPNGHGLPNVDGAFQVQVEDAGMLVIPTSKDAQNGEPIPNLTQKKQDIKSQPNGEPLYSKETNSNIGVRGPEVPTNQIDPIVIERLNYDVNPQQPKLEIKCEAVHGCVPVSEGDMDSRNQGVNLRDEGNGVSGYSNVWRLQRDN